MSLARLTGWSKTNQTAMIPAAALAGITNPAGLEMVIDQGVVGDPRCCGLQIHRGGWAPTVARVTFREPEGKIEFQHPWPPVTVKTNYPGAVLPGECGAISRFTGRMV